MQPRTPPSEPRSGSDALNTNNDVHDGFHTSTKSTRDTGVEPQSTSQPANGPQQNSDRDNDRAEDDDDDSWLRHQGSDVMDVVNGSDENDSDSYYPPSSSSFHGEVNVEARKPSDREDSSDFVDMDTQQRADPLCLYSFRVRPELCRPTGQQIPPSELVEELQKNHESGKRSELRKHVPGTLRKLEQDKDWPAIARFLRVDSERALAMEKLQTLLMDLRTSQDSTMRDQLLEVDTITKAVILDLVSDSPDLLPMLTLHLMTLSAITSRCPKPQSHQYALGKAMSKPKGGSEGRKQVVLRVVHAFHEGVDKAMDQAGSFRDLAQGLLQHTDRGKWKTVFARASFCETVVNIFSLLNEVKHHGWNKQGEVLLQILHDAYGDGGFGRPSKAKLGEECNGALDLSLVRQMVLLLKTTFEEVDDQSPVPGRWLSDEALFQGKYGDPNMVFNTGTFTYEVYTLGAHPFASYDHTMTYEEILMKRMTQPGSTELANPPCIPREVHKLIRQCTHHNPDMRPQLSSLPDRLQKSSVSERKDEREPGLERVLSLKKRYPEISKSQEGRKHVPETGIPNSVQDALLAGKKSDLYNKARQSSVQRPGKKNVVKESELTPKDWIHISHQDERTVVEEVVSSEFVSDVLPTLRACDLNGVTCFSHNDDVRTRIDRRNGETVHQRVYDAATVSLENAARSHCLWEKEDVQSFFSGYDVEDDGQHMRVLVLLISLIRTVRDLHKKGWIARDLREESILVDKSTNEVILARIGRMHRLPSTDSYFVDEVPKDSFRRLGPEVLVSGRYGRENDVFQLGTLILQLYRILAITQNSPSAERRDFAPCPSYPAEKLANYIRDPNREEEPLELCPGWLKELSDRCRHADPEKRPTASQLLDSLESHQRDPVTLSVGKDSQIADPHHTGPAQQGMTSNVQPRRRQLSARQLARPRSRSKSPLRNFTTRPRRRSIWRTMKARFTRKKTNRKQRGTFTNGVVSEETEVEVNWSDGHVSDNSSDSGSPVELQCGDMIPDPDQTLLKTVYHDCQSSYDPLSSTTVAGLQSVDKTNNCDVTVPKIKASKNDSLLFPSEMTTNQLERTRAQSVATPCAGFPKERLRLASPVRTDRHSSFFTSSTFLAECAPQTSRQHHVPSRGNTHGSAHVLYYRFPTRGSHDKNTQPGTLSLFPIHLPSPRGQNLNPYDPGDDKTASDDDSSLRGTGTDISTEDNKQSDVGIEPSACVRPDKTTTIPSDREMSTNTWSGLGRTAGSDQDTHKKTHFQHSNSEKTQLRQSDSNIVHLTPHHGKTLPSSEDPLSHEENIGNAAKRKTRHTRNQFDPKENLENADSSSPKQEDSAVTAQAEYTNNEAIRADCKDDRCDVYANEVETWKVLRSGPVSSDYQMSHDTDVDEESDIHMNEESLTMKPVASTQTKRDPSSPLPPIPHSDNATYSRLSQNRLLPASGRPAPHSRTVHCVTQSVCQRASALGQTDTAALKRTSDHQSVTTRSITPTVVQSGSSTQHATTTLAPKGKRGNADSSGPKREEETDTKGEGSKQEMGRQFSSNRKSEMETISGDSHADEDNIYMNEGDSCQKVCDVHTELDPDNAPDSESVQQGKTSISEETQCNGPSDHPETQRSVACTRTGRNRMSSIPLIPNNVHVEHSGLAQSRSLSASKRPTSRSAAVSNMTQSVSQRASALGQRDTAALKRTSDHQSVTTSSITPTVVQSGSSTQHATTTLAPKGKRGNADSSAPKREEETDTKGEGSKQEMGRQFSSNRKLRMVPTTTGPIDTAISAQAEYTNSEAILVDHKDDHCGMYANEAETNGFTDSEQKTLTVIPAIDIVYRSDPMSGDCQMAHDSDPGEENGTYMNNVDVGSSSFAQSQSLSTSERPFSLSGTIQCLMESRPHLDVTTSSVTDHDQRSATNEATDRDNSSHQTSTESNRQDTVYEVSSLPMRPDDHMYSDLFSADSS
ncbi:uncharacterized protein LOC143291709 isoform X2 [Babylonia areolata]|uniref:uncharacterized protein LOC143291709 isoform X2 n=1 Tax=Babylonia areolata TaxID=304850 RepID=UPI003FD4A805